LDKYIKIIIIVLIIGFLSLSLQIWSQARAINKLHDDIEKMEVKVEAVRELLFRIGSG
jgi:cell division protein FtsL|tara:strand:+ start:3223 stop:3396 length:174 start_codon:yes stop_codon:yes gene_type:complete